MTTVIQILAALVLLASGYRIWRRLRHYLHIFQLEGYKRNQFRGWLSGLGKRTIFLKEHVAGFVIVAALFTLTSMTGGAWLHAAALVLWLTFLGSARKYRSDAAKKPLVFTPRMGRLAGAVVILSVVLFGAVLGVMAGRFGWIGALLTGLLMVDVLAPYLVLSGGIITRPVENRVQEGFKRSARAKLESRSDLTVVGITGSYGKTSVKFAIEEILSQRFNVLATPASYNTPMGICKVINDDLRRTHQYLILEMGARYPGDIAELCEIARPDVAVLTSIGVAHLETMGSKEAIARTKKELIDHMKPEGPVIANADDPRVMEIVTSARGPLTTVSVESRKADVVAGDISYGLDGCRFTVTAGDEGEEMHSTLLGAHNVTNILLGLAAGRLFGLRLRQMKHAVARLRPVPHRLELRHEGAITVIDDSFNSNPVGARNAVEILGRFGQGKRVIVTPGMVELGSSQEKENHDLGTFMADHVDLAVLVGAERTEPIRAGLLEAGFEEDSIIVCGSLFEARDMLKEKLSTGDVVLYENDLPDQYEVNG